MNTRSSGAGPSGQGGSAGKSGPPELLVRTISALVLIAITLVLTWQGGITFALLCAAVSGLVLQEYLGLVKSVVSPTLHVVTLVDLVIVLGAWFFISPYYALLAFATFFVLLAAFELNRSRTFWSPAGLAYAALPFMALAMLRGSETVGLHALLFLFACVWGTDALAYFAGRAIGGPKLAPIISPKKTWSGAIGGIAGAIIAGLAVLYFAGYQPGVATVFLIVGLSIASQIGDLGESWLKRHFGIKDSGNIIPGHGGVLDRLDGLIVAGVAAWLSGSLLAGDLLTPSEAARSLFAAFVLP